MIFFGFGSNGKKETMDYLKEVYNLDHNNGINCLLNLDNTQFVDMINEKYSYQYDSGSKGIFLVQDYSDYCLKNINLNNITNVCGLTKSEFTYDNRKEKNIKNTDYIKRRFIIMTNVDPRNILEKPIIDSDYVEIIHFPKIF